MRSYRIVLACVAGLVSGVPAAHALGPILEVGAEFRFAEPHAVAYRVEQAKVGRAGLASGDEWLRAALTRGSTQTVWLGSRVALELSGDAALPATILGQHGLRMDRTVGERFWILQAPDPWSAARAAQALAEAPGVRVATPVMRRARRLHGGFAPRPNDPYYTNQWHLEDRSSNGTPIGPDVNSRAAWAVTRGEGITIAVADDGLETTHPDLARPSEGAPHFDFFGYTTNAVVNGIHATCVAGMAAAAGDNAIGVTGVAPAAHLASWTIFNTWGDIASDEALHDMFEHRLDDVEVQNHSWGNATPEQSRPSALELQGLANAIRNGRGGKGMVIVRSAGNGRGDGFNANDDGYPNDPRVICVAAAGKDGRAASYSNPGACVLVSAPSGDASDDFNPTENLYTTDRVGSEGYNRVGFTNDLANYAFDAFGFTGTSGAAPQIAGVAALMLAANPALTYRDVQQVLLHAGRHWDLADPDVRTNGVGYRVSHNQGFGLPDAGQAVALARAWSNRPAPMTLRRSSTDQKPIPDDGLRVWIREGDPSAPERSIHGQPALGAHPDEPTASLPLVYVGLATNEITADLHGKAALIERGTNFFWEKIDHVARAGAAFAVIFNNRDGDQVLVPGGTDFDPIPSMLISENDGRPLVAQLEAGTNVLAQLRLEAVSYAFEVEETWACEHVGLRVLSDHGRRADVRITLVSPSGNRSVLQRINSDSEPGPEDWTYWSVQHFYEPSAGTWTAWISDEDLGPTGQALEVELIIRGVSIEDRDRDGLDDRWEQRYFGSLAARPAEDPDRDGSWNAREQVLGTVPTAADSALTLSVSAYDQDLARLSWPASNAYDYRILGGDDVVAPAALVTNIPGVFPETEWITPVSGDAPRFFRVQAVPRPTPAMRLDTPSAVVH